MRKFNFESKIFKKYLSSYIVIIFSMAIVLFAWCSYNYNKYKKESIQTESSQVENFSKSTDEILKNLYYSVNNLLLSEEFSRVNMEKDIESLRTFNYKVKTCTYPFTKAEEIIVYLESVDKYVCNGVYSHNDFYYNNFIYGDYTNKQWEKEVLKCTEVIKFLPVKDSKYGAVKKKLMPIVISGNRVKVIALLDPEIFSVDEKYISIVGTKNNCLYNQLSGFDVIKETKNMTGEKVEQNFIAANDEKYLLSYCKSNFSGIKYAVLSSKQQILSNALVYRDTAVIILTICFFAEFLLALYFSVTNTTPLHKLINKIKDNIRLENDGMELENIGNSILNFIEKSNDLNNQLEKSFENIKENFLYRVLTGGFTTNSQAQKYKDSFDIDIDDCNYFVCIIEINGMNKKILNEMDIMEFSTVKVLINDMVKDVNDKIIPIDTNDNTVVLICASDHGEEVVFNSKLKMIIKEIKLNFGLDVFVAIGDIYEEIIGIFYSYTEATSVINHMELSGKTGVLKHSEIKHKNVLFYYPLEIEQRIITLVKSGEKAEVGKVFEILYTENLKRRELSPVAFGYLKNAVISTFMRAAELLFKENDQVENNVDMLIEEIKGEANAVDFFVKTSAFFSQLCDIVSMSAEGKNQKLKCKVEDYINNNYFNSDFSLYMVSKEFNLSESYFSRFFKELFNCNFSSWVENKRVSEATKLLSDTNMKITQIAEKTGYNSSQVMCRAFKKIMGITPDEYRKKL